MASKHWHETVYWVMKTRGVICSSDLDEGDMQRMQMCMRLYHTHPWAFLCQGEEVLRFMQSLEKQA